MCIQKSRRPNQTSPVPDSAARSWRWGVEGPENGKRQRGPVRVRGALSAALLFTACTTFPGAPTSHGLPYGEPDPNPTTYTFSDSTTFGIDAPGYGLMEVESARRGTAELLFQTSNGALDVTVRFPELEATFRNPSQGTSRSTEEDIGGPIGVRLSFAGELVVTDTPSMSPTLLEVAGPEALVRPFFVRLPGRQADPGHSWVDTVTSIDESGGTVTTATNIVTSTLTGDTLVAGRRLLVIATEAATSIESAGVSGGVQVEQLLSGTLRGIVLWDERGNLLVDRAEAGTLTGTLSMSAAGVTPMQVSADVRRRITLRP